MISLHKASRRRTEAYIVRLGEHELLFSYNTPVAYRGPLGSCHAKNTWGPTTGRHLNESGMRRGPEVEEARIAALVPQIVLDVGHAWLAQQLNVNRGEHGHSS